MPWLREQWPSPIYINTSDAKRLDIKQGETVLVTSPQGKILRPALVTQTMKPVWLHCRTAVGPMWMKPRD